MKIKTATIISIIAIILVASFIVFIPKNTYADFDTGAIYIDNSIVNEAINTVDSHFGVITDKIASIGSAISVIALILVGIKYMISSVEERTVYKEAAVPYVIGATLVFAISKVISFAAGLGSSLSASGSTEDALNMIVRAISTVGTIVSIVVLVVIGIKYMSQSTAETQLDLKKKMLPYVIGAVIVFAASNIASVIFNALQGL